MNTKGLLAAALALPIVVLGAMTVQNQRNLSEASEWVIPVEGYDPRDLLRGHYIRFTYDWDVVGNADLCRSASDCVLCLSKAPTGRIQANLEPADSRCRFRLSPSASQISLNRGFGDDASAIRFGSRLFVSEKTAPALEAALRTQPMVVVAKLGPDGRLINRTLRPAAAPSE